MECSRGSIAATVVDVAKERDMGTFPLANRCCYIRRHPPLPRTVEGSLRNQLQHRPVHWKAHPNLLKITFDEDVLAT